MYYFSEIHDVSSRNYSTCRASTTTRRACRTKYPYFSVSVRFNTAFTRNFLNKLDKRSARRPSVVMSSTDSQERILVAGFPVAEIPIIRRTLDDSGGYHIDMIVCSPETLLRPLKQVFDRTPPIEWLKPIPEEWIDGQGWGQMRVILFSKDIPHVHQLDIIQILHDIGMPRLYSGSAAILTNDAEDISVADALALAVQYSPTDDDLFDDEDFSSDESEDEDDFMQESVNLQDMEYKVIDEIFSSCQELE